MITEAVGHEINKMLARCGCHKGNNDEFELHSESGKILPGEHIGIYWLGEKVGSFSYCSDIDNNFIFVGKEFCAVLPTDPHVNGAWFADGPLENDIDDTVSLIDGRPPEKVVANDLVYYLVYEPDYCRPQEIGGRFVYSVNPGSILR